MYYIRRPYTDTIMLIGNYQFFQRRISEKNHFCQQCKRAGVISQTACQNRPLATRTLIKPTSPLSQPASSFLMQSHVNCRSYLPSLSHSSLFSWSDYSLHFQLMPQSRKNECVGCGGGGGGVRETDFWIVFEMWTDCKWSEQEMDENRQRCCSPRLCRSTSGSPPCALGASLRRAPLPS